MLSPTELTHMAEHFYGYGRWGAPFWFIGSSSVVFAKFSQSPFRVVCSPACRSGASPK